MNDLVSAEGWGWRYAGRTAWAARGIDLSVRAGERVLLLRPSGAGKSTLLLALAGVLGGADEGVETGRLLVDGWHPTRRVGQIGLVRQDPAAQIVLARVGDDVAFGAENLGMPRAQIWPRVRAALAAVGLHVDLDRDTSALSGGEQQRLVLAGALAMRGQARPTDTGPHLLLLDEPTANLDPAGLIEVRDAVAGVVADRNLALILVEHRVEAWLDLIDRVVVLGEPGSGGGVIADGAPGEVFAARGDELAEAGVWVPDVPLPLAPRARAYASAVGEPVAAGDTPPPTTPDWALRTHDLSVGYATDHPVRDHLDVIIPRGLSTVIVGHNGAGKSALALTLAGLLPPLAGTVTAASWLAPAPQTRRQRRLASDTLPPLDALPHPNTWTSRQVLTRLGTVFQQPEHQFVTGSVRDELSVGLRALRWPAARIDARVAELLDLLHLDDVARANPFTLSGGQQRRLSVGTVLATQPSVVIMDEPTFGQDRVTWLDMVALVRRLVDEGGTVVSVTHDASFRDILGEHVIDLDALP
jgi:energy-coupling factor transport system ATP-binding protein